MQHKNLTKHCLFLFLIIFFGFYSFGLAQEEKQGENKFSIPREYSGFSIGKITEKIEKLRNDFFSVWEKVHQKIIEIWKQKNFSKTESPEYLRGAKVWIEKEISFLKEEFRKEKQEMEQEFWQWFKFYE